MRRRRGAEGSRTLVASGPEGSCTGKLWSCRSYYYFFFLMIQIFKKIYLILFIFGCVGSLLWCAGFSLQWLLLLQSKGSRRAGSVVVARRLSSYGSRALEHRLSSCGAWA